MSFALMRIIDHWIGKPLVWLLSWFTARPRSLYGDSHFSDAPKRVVLTKFIGLGSVVLSLPLLKALKSAGVQVVFWSFPGQADLLKSSGFVDKVLVIRPSARHFLSSLIGSWLEVRRFKPDAFLDLEPTANFTAILARLSGARTRVGFISSKPLREAIFTHLVALTSERHMVENNLCMGKVLGLKDPLDPALPSPRVASGEGPLPATPGMSRVVLNVNASDLSWHRMWPARHWVELSRKLLQNPTVELVFCGGPGERARVEEVTSQLGSPGRVHNVAGRTTLSQLVQLLHGADQVISVDSGIMHLAAWVGVPVVGLFGPETPSLYAPRPPVAKVVWARLPCSPCLSVAAEKITRCRDNQCMKLISAEQVWVASNLLLQQNPRKITAA